MEPTQTTADREHTPPYLNRAHRVRRARRVLLYLLGVTLTCGGICGGMYWFFEYNPQYLELDPPSNEHIEWHRSTTRAIVTGEGALYRYYTWRRTAWCIKDECGSWQDVLTYFKSWLEAEEWSATWHWHKCRLVIPEQDYLKQNVEQFIEFWPPPGMGNYNYQASVCLAILQSPDIEGHWHIVLGTVQPSLLTDSLQ